MAESQEAGSSFKPFSDVRAQRLDGNIGDPLGV